MQEWAPAERVFLAGYDKCWDSESGARDAAQRRNVVGKTLGIGYANAKGFLYRLNNYGVTREEFNAAVNELNGGAVLEDEKTG